MSTKHTPGPWGFGFESVDPEWSIVTNKGGRIIANVNADARRDANARLIAAAPDMLAALKAAERFVSGFEGDELQDGIDARLAMIRAAIAKAEGGAP